MKFLFIQRPVFALPATVGHHEAGQSGAGHHRQPAGQPGRREAPAKESDSEKLFAEAR